MGLYSRIKKRHVFIFLIFLCALIIFDSFNFGYSGLVIKQKDNCLAAGGVCCKAGSGVGERYFSLDSTCGDRECWGACGVSEGVSYGVRQVTGFGVIDWFGFGWSDIKKEIGKLFGGGDEVVGGGVGETGCVGVITDAAKACELLTPIECGDYAGCRKVNFGLKCMGEITEKDCSKLVGNSLFTKEGMCKRFRGVGCEWAASKEAALKNWCYDSGGDRVSGAWKKSPGAFILIPELCGYYFTSPDGCKETDYTSIVKQDNGEFKKDNGDGAEYLVDYDSPKLMKTLIIAKEEIEPYGCIKVLVSGYRNHRSAAQWVTRDSTDKPVFIRLDIIDSDTGGIIASNNKNTISTHKDVVNYYVNKSIFEGKKGDFKFNLYMYTHEDRTTYYISNKFSIVGVKTSDVKIPADSVCGDGKIEGSEECDYNYVCSIEGVDCSLGANMGEWCGTDCRVKTEWGCQGSIKTNLCTELNPYACSYFSECSVVKDKNFEIPISCEGGNIGERDCNKRLGKHWQNCGLGIFNVEGCSWRSGFVDDVYTFEIKELVSNQQISSDFNEKLISVKAEVKKNGVVLDGSATVVPKVKNEFSGYNMVYDSASGLWKKDNVNLKCDVASGPSSTTEWVCSSPGGTTKYDNAKGCLNQISVEMTNEAGNSFTSIVDVYCKKETNVGGEKPCPGTGDDWFDGGCVAGAPYGGSWTLKGDNTEYNCPNDKPSCVECNNKNGLSWAGDGCYSKCDLKVRDGNTVVKGYIVDPNEGFKGTDCLSIDYLPLKTSADSRNVYYLPHQGGNEYCSKRFGADRGYCYGVRCKDGYEPKLKADGILDLDVNGDLVCVLSSANVPNAPTGLTATYDDVGQKVTLTWNWDDVLGGTGSVVGVDSVIGEERGFEEITGEAVRGGVVRQRGFFGKIWDWIKGLFGGGAVALRPEFDEEARCTVTEGYCIYRVKGDGVIRYVGSVIGKNNFIDDGLAVKKDLASAGFTLEYYIQTVKGGKTSELSSPVSVRITGDEITPVITIVSPLVAERNIRSESIKVVITATDVGSGVANVWWVRDGSGGEGSTGLSRDAASGNWVATVTGLVEGDNNIVVYAKDSADNIGQSRFVVKRLAPLPGPIVTIVSPIANAIVSDKPYVEVRATVVAADASINVNKVTAINENLNDNKEFPMYLGEDGVWKTSISDPVMPHLRLDYSVSGKSNRIKIVAVDSAGKSGESEVVITCNYREPDRTPPLVSFIGANSLVNTKTIDINVKIDDDAHIDTDTYSGTLIVTDSNKRSVDTKTGLQLKIGEGNKITGVKLFGDDVSNYEGESTITLTVVDNNAGEGVTDVQKTTTVSHNVNVDTTPPFTYIKIHPLGETYGSGNSLQYAQGVRVTIISAIGQGEVHGGSGVITYYKVTGDTDFLTYQGKESYQFEITKREQFTITAYSKDLAGNVEQPHKTQVVSIVEPNKQPKADFTSHSSGDKEFSDVDVIKIYGRVVDDDNEGNDLTYVWSVDGVDRSSAEGGSGKCIGTSCAANIEFKRGVLNTGKHIISLKATDSKGGVGESSIELEIIERVKPSVSIKSPVENSIFEVGKQVTFIGIGDDRRDPEGKIVKYWWDVDDKELSRVTVTGASADTEKFIEKSLDYVFENVGDHNVGFYIEDNNGNIVGSHIDVVTNEVNSPEPSIESPEDNAKYVIGGSGDQSIMRFRGSADDRDSDGVSDGTIVSWTWTLVKNAGLEGETRIPVGAGSSFERTAGRDITEGYYNVELVVEDDDGNVGKAVTENIHVKSKNAPTAVIRSPYDEEVFLTTQTIDFIGEANDPDGDDIAVWRWSSDLSGVLNDGSSWSADDGYVAPQKTTQGGNEIYTFSLKAGALSLGRHKIKLLVIDSSAMAYEDTYVIHITIDPSYAPNVRIKEPALTGGTTSFDEGELITFIGAASDPNRGDGKVCRYEWSSNKISTRPLKSISRTECDLGGDIQDLPAYSTYDLSVGNHEVTLRVWDEEGLSSHATIFVNVRAVPLTLLKPRVAVLNLGIGSLQDFEVAGGLKSYVWKVNGDCGVLDKTDGSKVRFTAVKEGSCKVVITSGSQSTSVDVVVAPIVLRTPTLTAELSNDASYGYVMNLVVGGVTDADISSLSDVVYHIQYHEGDVNWKDVTSLSEISGSGGKGYIHYGGVTCAERTSCLTNGKTYSYKVRIESSEGVSLWSTPVSRVMNYDSFKEDCTKPTEDTDLDGIVAGIDASCPNLNKVKLGDKIGGDIPNDNKTYVSTKVNILCYFSVINPDTGAVVDTAEYYNSGVKCINAKVGDSLCVQKEAMSTKGAVTFRKCSVGDSVGEKEVKCEVDARCNVGGVGVATRKIEVVDFEYCEDGMIGTDLVIDKFGIDESSYRHGENIEAEISVKNEHISERDLDVIVEVQLYDISTNTKVVEDEESGEIEYGKKEKFVINLTVPEDADVSDEYVVLAKAYVEGDEDENCAQKKIFVDINKKTKCKTDNDGDGYISWECGGDDCNDARKDVHSKAIELCSDGIDNDCDGKIDSADTDCSTCNDGAVESCGSSVGECRPGTKTCVAGVWGRCNNAVGPAYEVCGDVKDNDCDGLIDCDDYDCYTDVLCDNDPDVDSDGDGLPDYWERTFWTTLGNGADEDFDGDGFTNYEEWLNGTDPTVRDDVTPSRWWVWVLIVLVVGGVVSVLVVFLVKNKKGGKSGKPSGFVSGGGRGGYARATKPVSGGGTTALKEYVRKAQARGFSRSQIERVLAAKGWSKRDIDNAFR